MFSTSEIHFLISTHDYSTGIIIFKYTLEFSTDMFEALYVLGLGFILGLEHALDADHIAAVTTLVTKHRNLRKASLLGAFWGLGHTTTLFFAGILILTLKIAIPKIFALSLEFIVGIMIVVLGTSVLWDLFVRKRHTHKHKHGSIIHTHVHTHKHGTTHTHYHKPFIVGLIHGLAGSAALMLLVLSTVESIVLGLAYILIFGLGSVLGMAIVSSAISIPFVFTKNPLLKQRIRYLAGVFSILFGLYLMADVGSTLFL